MLGNPEVFFSSFPRLSSEWENKIHVYFILNYHVNIWKTRWLRINNEKSFVWVSLVPAPFSRTSTGKWSLTSSAWTETTRETVYQPRHTSTEQSTCFTRDCFWCILLLFFCYLVLRESVLHLEVKWFGWKRHSCSGKSFPMNNDPVVTEWTKTHILLIVSFFSFEIWQLVKELKPNRTRV